MTPFRKFVLFAALSGLLLLAAAFGLLRRSIQRGVETFAAQAQQQFPVPGDDIAALIAVVQSGDIPLTGRNHAVWALGQLRDARALPVLEAARTGRPCDHAVALCQREIEKAIQLCRGRLPNILRIHGRRAG